MPATSLTLSVYTAPSRPISRSATQPPPPGGWTWPPTAVALISGERDAVLIDTLIATDDVEKLADWVASKHKNLSTIYVTHDHPDHYAGAPGLLSRFPKARLVATDTVVASIASQLPSGSIEGYWRPMFGGKVAEAPVVPEILKGDTIDLEGHPIRVLPAAQSDTIYSTYIFIPELSAVFAGDVAYNDVHMNIASTDHAKRLAWISSLEEIAARKPKVVVAAHRRPDADDTPENALTKSIRYLKDFDALLDSGKPTPEIIKSMLAAYPTRLNVTTLYHSAYQLAR
jgi:glyoxylase-like metal-dependent hydrolase (beta-lactamase superfamily II)